MFVATLMQNLSDNGIYFYAICLVYNLLGMEKLYLKFNQSVIFQQHIFLSKLKVLFIIGF